MQIWDIPKAKPANKQQASKESGRILELWKKGLSAKEIAGVLGQTEKTVLNQVALLRKAMGDQAVPRRK